MRIYLACTVRGDRGTISAAHHIHDRLVELGHEVLTSHLLRDDVDAVERNVSNRDVFLRDLAWLDSADVVVAEASGSTFGVGFEVGYMLGRAATTGQRAYVLYRADRRETVSRMISGLSHAQGAVLGYTTLAEIDAFLDIHLSGNGLPPRGHGR
jgi:nucleoside 2-deoxyribosyltransferase